MEWISESIEKQFPNLTREVYHKTSEQDDFHNCIAYAAGDESRWWEPPLQPGIVEPGYYWPEGAPTTITIESLVKAYELHGFALCDSDSWEEGYEKVALFGYENNDYAHASKLMQDGTWKSKLGNCEDIMHETCHVLEADRPAYGKVRKFMKRSIK